MRPFAIAAVLVFAATPVSADHIGIYDDTSGGPCFGPPPPPYSYVTMYVLHEQSAGSLGGRWSVVLNGIYLIAFGYQCAGGVWVSADPFNMVASYGSCQSSPITACQIEYLLVSDTPIEGCNHVRVTPYLGDNEVQVLDCAQQFQNATAGHFSFDRGGNCDTCVLATEATTWGSVKALYR